MDILISLFFGFKIVKKIQKFLASTLMVSLKLLENLDIKVKQNPWKKFLLFYPQFF